MFNNYKACFSGSDPKENNFSPYDLYALTEVYNKTLRALDETIIPYVSNILNPNELKMTLSQYPNMDFLGAINKLVSGMALLRVSNSDGNFVASKLLTQYEDFFGETKSLLNNLRYDFAFASVIAFDKFYAELKNFKRSPRAYTEHRYKLKEIERIVNNITSELGEYTSTLTGNISFDAASDITHLLHTHDINIRIHSLAALIIKFDEIKNIHTKKQLLNRQLHKNTQTNKAISQAADEIAYMRAENAELKQKLNDAEKRAQKQMDDNTFLEQIFGTTDKDKEIAELKQEIDILNKENTKLRKNTRSFFLGRRY